MRWLMLLLLLTVLQASSAWAQATGRITGQVTNEGGQPLTGAVVNVVASGQGVITGADGRFVLNGVRVGPQTVRVTLLGYAEQALPVTVVAGVPANLAFHLKLQAVALDAVVAVGYGTVRRGNLTGSVAQVGAPSLEDRPVARVEDALQGQMAGVQLRETTGMPGAALEVRVRGSASISAGNDPLYVVDGVPVDDLANINPDEIASIEVLKDASSAAIYGSRGANGVVLVTTKTGRAGAPQFTFRTSQGVSTLAKKLDLLSPAEWIDLVVQVQNDNWVRRGQQLKKNYQASDPIAFRQAELGVQRNATYIADPRWAFGCDSVACVDWQNEFYRPAYFANYELAAAGGTDNLRYRVSGAYLRQNGIAVYTGYDRANLRANFDAQLNKRLHLAMSLAPSVAWTTGGNVDGKDQQSHHVLAMVPVAERDAGVLSAIKPYDRYYWAGSTVSPVGFQEFSTNDDQDKTIFSKLDLTMDLLPGLTGNVTGGWNSLGSVTNIYYPTKVQAGGVSVADGTRSDGRYNTSSSDQYLGQATLNYDRLLGHHSITALLGGSTEYYEQRGSSQRNTNFANDLLTVLNNTTSTVNTSTNTIVQRSLLSYFGRVMYSYEGKYLASASLRLDGSSKFGQDNKWGFFPAFSLGWRVSQEPFLRNVHWLTDLKLRGSWGVTGNNSIPDYVYYGSLGVYNTSFNNALSVGYGPSSLSNPNLGWEQTQSTDAGFDLGLFEQRISFTADYYNKLTTNLLLQVPVALATGFATGWQNIGKARNEGVELALTGRVGGRRLQWTPSANLSFNRNKVVQLGPGNAPIYTGFSGQTQIIEVGQSLNAFYMYDAIGVYRDSADLANSPHMKSNIIGDVKYRDVNGDGVIDANDRTLLGHRDPTYTWGLTNSFTYGSVDLSFLLQGQGGNRTYNIIGRAVDRPGMGVVTEALGRWRNRWRSPSQPGDGFTPRIDGTTGGLYDSRWLYDGTYMTLRNVTLGYRLPARLHPGLGPTRLFLTADNVFMRDHDYGGYSPESENGSNGDYGSYPTSRTFTLGLTTSF